MAGNGPDIVKRHDRLEAAAAQHYYRWERMAPYLAPSRVGIQTEQAPGESRTRGVYDSTSMMAAELMAMFVAGHIINPSQQWLDFSMKQFNRIDPIREWLDECRVIALKHVDASLYYAEQPEAFIDWAGFGTGCLMVEEAPQPVNLTKTGFRGFLFGAERTGRFLIQDGPDGVVDTLFRRFKMTARVINERWPQASLPENIQNKLKTGRGDDQFTIIHSVYPRSKGERASYGTIEAGTTMPWASCWVEKESKHLIYESGYRVFPAAVPRYHRTPGEVFGRGRGDIAFPDTWTLNTAKRMGLEDWALKIRPPILHGHDSVIGTLKLIPGGPTSVNTHGRPIRDQIMPFETGSRPEISQIKEEELRKSIRNIFFVEQILALLEVNKSEMTAFEFARKIELLFRLMGPVYGRLEWEGLYRIVEVIWDILAYARTFPPPPPEVYQTDGNVDIVFNNPIAKAQRAGEAESITMVVNDVGALAQNKPEMLDWIDTDKMMRGVMETRGMPARWQRSEREVAALRAERQKQMQTEMQLEQASQVAEAAGKAAPALQILQGGAAGVTKKQ